MERYVPCSPDDIYPGDLVWLEVKSTSKHFTNTFYIPVKVLGVLANREDVIRMVEVVPVAGDNISLSFYPNELFRLQNNPHNFRPVKE